MKTNFVELIQDLTHKEYQSEVAKSTEWFRRNVVAYLNKTTNNRKVSIDRFETIRKNTKTSSPFTSDPGFMYTFLYDPKTKETLPYYDTFPMILLLQTYQNGFLGLNFHYIYPTHRAVFFDMLMSYERVLVETDTKYVSMLEINYENLKKSGFIQFYKPCIKRYLFSHIGPKFYKLQSNEWRTCLFIPNQNFVKSSQELVWQESKLQYK